MKKKLKVIEAPKLLKLDLGCGKNKREGFLGVDALHFKGVDRLCDLRKTPWALADYALDDDGTPFIGDYRKLEDESVEEVHCSHFLEHLTQDERVAFFNELHRVLIKGGKASIITPHWLSERAYGDPTHKMPPVTFFSYFYVNKGWRGQNAPHTGYTCDFDCTGGNTIGAPWNARNQETQGFAQTHYANVAQDLHVTVTKK